MDLSEVRTDSLTRHPWEVARGRAIMRVLRDVPMVEAVLDYGCGDGFIGDLVQRGLRVPYLAGVDIHFPENALGRIYADGMIRDRVRLEDDLGDRRFDLILACDVIEHVEDDRGLLRRLVSRRSRPGSYVLITVPAYPILFSNHDRALRHFRRYTLAKLKAVAADSGLVGLRGGYLFSTLLIPRALSKVVERTRNQTIPSAEELGAGGWSGGQMKTRLLSWFLSAENDLLLAAASRRLILPGLTAWILCRTPS